MKSMLSFSFLLLIIWSCAHHPKSFTIDMPIEGKKVALEHILFSREYGVISMGGSRRSYKYHFYISNLENFQYAYLSIGTLGIRRSENSIYLNNKNIGYLESATSSYITSNKKNIGYEKAYSRTQKYLPQEYFLKGKNTLEIKAAEQFSAWRPGVKVFRSFSIKNLYIAIIKYHENKLPQHPQVNLTHKKVHFPDHIKFLSRLNNEELFIALTKLPFLITELSYPGSIYNQSLGYVYSRIGDFYRWTGYYQKNLVYQQKALKVQEQQKGNLLIPMLRSKLAQAHYYIGEYDEAMSKCEVALSEIENIKPNQLQNVTFHEREDPTNLTSLIKAHLSLYNLHLKRYEESEYYAYNIINNFFIQDSIGFGRRKVLLGKYVPISLAHQTMGDLCLIKKEFNSALKHYQKSIEQIKNEIRPEVYNDQIINIYLGIAKAYFHLHEYPKAIRTLATVKNPTNEYMWRSYLLQGLIAEEQGDLENACNFYVKSVSEIEFARAKLTSHGLKISFMNDKQEPYLRAIKCLVKLEKYQEAFYFTEKAKARAFLDLISNERETLEENKRYLSELSIEEKRLREELLTIQNKLDINSEMFEERGIKKNDIIALENARNSLNQFYKIKAVKNLDFASLRAENTLKINDVLKILPEDTALVELFYYQDQLYIWIISRSKFKFIEKTIQPSELEILVKEFRKYLSKPEQIRGIKVISNKKVDKTEELFSSVNNRLYDLFVKDVLYQTSAKRIYIVPYGILHYLPFQAIKGNDNYVTEDFQIGYSPSASVLNIVFNKRKKNKRKLFAIGNPKLRSDNLDLPFAEREVRSIGKIYNDSLILTGIEATESEFKKFAGENDIIHIASHGEFNPEAPLLSCLRLSEGEENEDGRLETIEIFKLDLKAYLVTLSACNTGLGKITKGDELIGLTRAFIFAGSPSIMGTFWSVNDESTSIFMKSFYMQLQKMDKIASLQSAQRMMIGSDRFSHPYYWAAFQMIGDYK